MTTLLQLRAAAARFIAADRRVWDFPTSKSFSVARLQAYVAWLHAVSDFWATPADMR